MNPISWLIYLADVAGNAGYFFGWTGAALLIIGITYFVCAFGFMSEVKKWDEPETKNKAIKVFKGQRRSSVVCVFFAFICWFIAVLMPSQNTVLAIAASQAGEQLLHTKTANLAEQALNAWLQKQIAVVPAAPATPAK